MAENNPVRFRLGHVFQIMYVQREKDAAKTTRPRVHDNQFDGSQHQGSQPSDSTSRSCVSQTSTPQGHESLDDEATPEAPEIQEELGVDAPLKSYPRGPFDTSLLHLYVDHVVRHVWE